MIDVINAGSGMNTASRDKFPRAILPRSFDYGFATGLMVKDVRLCLDEMKSLGLSMEVAEAVGRLWEVVIRDMGAESDFTSAIKPIEAGRGAGVGEWEPVPRRPTARRERDASNTRHAYSHGACLSIAISASTSMRGRTTAYWSSLTSTSGTSARVL